MGCAFVALCFCYLVFFQGTLQLSLRDVVWLKFGLGNLPHPADTGKRCLAGLAKNKNVLSILDPSGALGSHQDPKINKHACSAQDHGSKVLLSASAR